MIENPRLIIFSAYLIIISYFAISSFLVPSKSENYKKYYWIIVSPLIAYAILRPFPLMRDDPGYFDFFVRQNHDFVIHHLITLRDPIYHLSLYSLKKLFDHQSIILLLSGIVLTGKLWVISKFPKKTQFLVLLTYICLYYQLHDLTQMRVAMATMFFLFALHFSYYKKNLFSKSLLIFSFLSHASAILNFFLIFFAKFFNKKNIIYLTFIIIIILSWLNFYPDINFFKNILLNFPPSHSESYIHILNSYTHLYDMGVYDHPRPPIIFLILVFCYSFILREINMKKNINKICLSSFFIGSTVGYIFTSMIDIQVRLYEFYFIAGLFLIRQIKTKESFLIVMFLALMYFVKFNVKWNIGI